MVLVTNEQINDCNLKVCQKDVVVMKFVVLALFVDVVIVAVDFCFLDF